MATALSRLSSLLLTCSLFPAEDPARAILQARADHFSNLVTWSTVVVAIGVALEGVEIVHDVIAWIKQKRRTRYELLVSNEVAKIFPSGETRGQTESHSDHPRWVKRLLRLGLIAVVIGVVGEWRYGAKLEDSHNAIHEYDVALLGGAAKSAKTAHDEADKVKKEADELTIRLGNAAKQLGILEQDTLAQGPRWKLLLEAAPRLVKDLSPFAGQRVDLYIFGWPSVDSETFTIWGDLLTILGDRGAKWKVEHESPMSWQSGGIGTGISVYVSSRAAERTLKAANALGMALAKTLPPSPAKIPTILDPEENVMLSLDRGVMDRHSPMVAAVVSPDLITVLIAAHPQQTRDVVMKPTKLHK